MKKTLLLAAVGMLAASASMDAAIVYFENTQNWDAVYSYAYGGDGVEDAQPFTELTSEEIGGKTLYKRDTGACNMIIFLNRAKWDLSGKIQTGNLKANEDGLVYNGSSQLIGKIVDGSFTEVDPGDLPEPDLYLRGNMNGWNPSDAWKFTKGDDGLYTLTCTINGATTGNTFKIATDDWNTSYGSPDNDNMIEITGNGTYTLTPKPQGGGDNGNLINYETLTNVTLTFNPDTYELKVSDESGEDEELKWFAGWNMTGTWVFGNEMEKQEEGTYKLHLDIPADSPETNYFIVFQASTNTSFDTGGRYYPQGNTDLAVTHNVEYQISTINNNKCWTIGNGNWTIVVDPRDASNVKLSFELGNSTGEANVLIDRDNEPDFAGTFESYALEEVEGEEGKYTWTGTLKQGDKLKFNIHGVDYYYDPSIGTIQGDDVDFNGNIAIDYPLEEVKEGDNSFVTFDYDTDVTYTIDVTHKTITADLKNVPRVTVTITNAEGQSTIHRVNRQGTTRIYVSHAIECNPGDCVDFRLLNTRYECDFNSPVTRAAQVFNLVEANDNDQAPALNITEPTSITFTVDAENKTVTLEDDVETGVSSIAADNAEAVYFNLQGVQIEKPENGLFIEVRGNKATKVMVK